MNALLWRLRRIARRLGAGGLVSMALGLAALLLHLAGTLPRNAHLVEQRAHLAALRQQAAAHATTPAVQTADPFAALPPAGEAAQAIGELERLAHAHGFALPRGQYSVSAQAGTPLQRWQFVLPVEATYPALQAWLAAALARQPNLTLDEFKLKRERIESRTLQAELRMSLFVEAGP